MEGGGGLEKRACAGLAVEETTTDGGKSRADKEVRGGVKSKPWMKSPVNDH